MKKFLTVLLALSVVFTYTVGTAFAAEPTYAQKVVQAKQSVMDTLDTNYNNMVKTLADKNVSVTSGGTFTISKDAWTKVAGDLKSDKEAAIDLAAKNLAAATDTDKSVIELTALIMEDTNVGDITVEALFNELSAQTAEDDYVDAAGRYQVGIDKDAYLAKAATVDLSVYSTTTPADAEEKYYDQAKKAYDNAVKAINDAAVVAADADLAASRAAAVAVKNAFNTAFEETAEDSGIYKLTATIPTISDEAADATTLEAKKAALNSKVAAEAAAYMARCADAAKNDPNYDMEAKKEQKDAYVAVHTYRINALDSLADAQSYFDRINPVEDAASVVYEVNAVAELEKFAAKYKAEKDASGNIIRDAEAVDEIVAKATADIYANMAATTQTVDAIVEAAQKKIVDNKVDSLSNDTVGLAKAALEAKRETALDDYYGLEQKEVNARYDALIAKIDAAATDKEVEKVAKNADLTGILLKGQVEALYTGSGACASEFGKLTDKLDAYADYLKQLDSKKDFTNYNDAYWQAFCIDNDARTGAEVAALYDKAKAVLDGVKNSDVLKAERKAVEAKIDALPSTIALTDKAAVEDAKAALDAYMENNNLTTCDVVNEYVLDSAIDDLYEAEKKEVADAVKKLPAKITAADKDALKDIVAKVEAINDQIGDGLLYEGKATQTVPSAVTTALQNIKTAEAKAIKDAVDALPLNITTADADAIKAARDLYDAYVAEYTDYANNIVPAKQELAAVGSDLFKAEAALKVAEEEANAKEITAIKGTHMKIYSSAAKGYIKISWKASNTDVALDGVEVYRSTKKTSGFKKISTFKVQTSKKYSTNLKKGTKYYYYVKGYKMVGDEKVYTHNSITVGRTFRK